jgi:hypothetical protein
MLEKAAQSAHIMFQEFSNLHPMPPILFLVGSSKSHAHSLAIYLKEKFQYNVLLG